MSARYVIRPLGAEGIPEAAALLEASYRAEREASPLLPTPLLGGSREIEARIAACLPRGCVAAFDGERMAGFMGVSAVFPFKGQIAAMIGEWAHAGAGDTGAGTAATDAAAADTGALYRAMYAALGESLRGTGIRLHVVGHFAHDRVLSQALFDLGFGTIVMEELRDLAPVAGRGPAAESGGAPVDGAITLEENYLCVEELEAEHHRYYQQSPIFLMKDSSPEGVRAGLEETRRGENALFVYRVEGRPAAAFFVGRCAGDGEGRLLKGSGTAEVLSAYCRPSARGRGVGAALLDACVGWARERGYERLFVEHESANLLGGAFWGRHFSPFLRFSMRYVEAT